MNMIRSFLPVGQGAFCIEQFKNGVNVVYDCGSQTDVEIVEKMIESTFDRGEEIYAVFISHLHSDHINGLEFLLKYCRVKTLYLPYLTPQDILISTLIQDITQGGSTQFAREFIADCEGALKRYCKRNDFALPEVKYLLSQEDLNDLGPQIESSINQYLSPGTPVYVSVGTPERKWKYMPYNLKNTERKRKLIGELKRIGVEAGDFDSIKKKISTKSGMTEIRKAYEKIPGGLNTNSMVVYSGPDSSGQSVVRQRFVANPFLAWGCCECYGSIHPGCLYMGDFDASGKSSFSSLDKFYSDYWDKIGVLQIPHHGSKHNFNVDLLSRGSFYIIFAGADNMYKHPHAKVLKEIVMNREPFAWVTEKLSSTIRFEVFGL